MNLKKRLDIPNKMSLLFSYFFFLAQFFILIAIRGAPTTICSCPSQAIKIGKNHKTKNHALKPSIMWVKLLKNGPIKAVLHKFYLMHS